MDAGARASHGAVAEQGRLFPVRLLEPGYGARVSSLLPGKKSKPALSDTTKKLKIESAMANAAVRKLLRTIEKADGAKLDHLKQQLTEAERKAAFDAEQK